MPKRPTYGEPIRAAALQRRAETGESAPKIAAWLKAEHGQSPGATTVEAWLRQSRSALPKGDQKAQIRSMAERALALLSRELEALERQPRSKADLSKLDQIAKTLKVLDGLRPASSKAGGLAKLGELDLAERSSDDAEDASYAGSVPETDGGPLGLAELAQIGADDPVDQPQTAL